MNEHPVTGVSRTRYGQASCDIGIVHLGFGAFHRAHQAVFIDDYMDQSGDLNWGIAAVNLRSEEATDFNQFALSNQGYILKTTSPDEVGHLREVRSHVEFVDWSSEPDKAERLLSLPTVKAVSMTVTESGYYLNKDWTLNRQHPLIEAEVSGQVKCSVYAFLSAAIRQRIETTGAPVTILCCDNIRSNGDMLARNFDEYLHLMGDEETATWVKANATFPNSMVDRITPRATQALREEISAIAPFHSQNAVHGESFIQWVLENKFANAFPDLTLSGVEFVNDVSPYEEAKIRILNGGHSSLCYLGALAGYETFDQAMADDRLRKHFDLFQDKNVLPALQLDLPFDKQIYRKTVAERLSNAAIADELGRICMDGWSKFPIFIRPTLEGCLNQGISPDFGYDSIASWYVFARRFSRGQTTIKYIDPYWSQLQPLLAEGQELRFAKLEALWADLPLRYDAFASSIVSAIEQMEQQWPI